MHVFLDESGGAGAADGLFLAAAVAVAPGDAARLVRSFRKATGVAGEVHGHRLAPGQRALFLDLLAREAAPAAVVACRRAEPLGGWAMAALPEVELYGHLLAEACAALLAPAGAGGGRGPLTVTPDGGRHARARLDRARGIVAAALAAAGHRGPVRVVFGDSAATAGLQVADVVANSAFQALAGKGAAGGPLAPLVEGGLLRILPLRLAGLRPAWIAGP